MPEPILVRLRNRLGFSSLEVASAGGWSRQRFAQMEKSGDLDTSDALRLTDLYGVDVCTFLTTDQISGKRLPVAALLKGNAEVLTADARFAMTEAVSVSRDITELKKVLGIVPPVAVTAFGEDKDLSHPESGNVERLAALVRKRLHLSGVVKSVVTDICEQLGINIFEAEFNDPAVDAFSAWSPDTGALIVVNRKGRNAGGRLGIRTTLTHEVAHLLFDRAKMRQIGKFCEVGQRSSSNQGNNIEQRARAFQVELLAPKSDVLTKWKSMATGDYPHRVAELAAFFGIGPVAAAWQLANAGGPPYSPVSTTVNDVSWTEWQQILGDNKQGPEEKVPALRRRILLPLVKAAVQGDEISTSWARELLRLSTGDWDDLRASWT